MTDQGDPDSIDWIEAGGDPRDRGKMVELIARDLSGAEHFIAWGFDRADLREVGIVWDE